MKLNGMQPMQQRQIQIDLSKAAQRACVCGCQLFTPAIKVYTVSALVSPTGQELTAQAQVLLCLECKAVLPVNQKETAQ